MRFSVLQDLRFISTDKSLGRYIYVIVRLKCILHQSQNLFYFILLRQLRTLGTILTSFLRESRLVCAWLKVNWWNFWPSLFLFYTAVENFAMVSQSVQTVQEEDPELTLMLRISLQLTALRYGAHTK